MKRIKTISVLITAAILSLSSLAEGAETVAVVLKVQGSVLVTSSGETSPKSVQRGSRLAEGDKLVTGIKSFVAFRFIDDASLVRIGANSTCTIQGQKEANRIMKNIVVEAGTILTRITQQKGTFQVATPTSVASVKGTEFMTVYQQTQGSDYYCNEGSVEVSNDAGFVMMNAGYAVHVASKDSEPVLRKMQPGEMPSIEEDLEEDELELEFENDAGQKKYLRFKVKKTE